MYGPTLDRVTCAVVSCLNYFRYCTRTRTCNGLKPGTVRFVFPHTRSAQAVWSNALYPVGDAIRVSTEGYHEVYEYTAAIFAGMMECMCVFIETRCAMIDVATVS